MAMMIAVLVVIAEHPSIVGRAYARVNVGESVLGDFTVLQPHFAFQIAAAALAGETRDFSEVLHIRLSFPLPRHQVDPSSIDI
jgi:hypothetical protein